MTGKFKCSEHRYCYCDPKGSVEAMQEKKRLEQEKASLKVGWGINVDGKLEPFIRLSKGWINVSHYQIKNLTNNLT